MSSCVENLPGVSHSFCGVRGHAVTMDDLTESISRAIQANRRLIVGHNNMHGLYLARCHEEIKQFYRLADIVYFDGMALIAMGRLLGIPLERRHRVTGVDWIWPLMRYAASQKWKVFYLSSKSDVLREGVAVLRQALPDLEIVSHHGYFDSRPTSPENARVVQTINEASPDLLIVGMGMPRQEQWVLENHAVLQARVILTWGATIDYLAGAIPTPPRWLGQCGCEWLYRLLSEPRRMSRRYLIEPWSVAGTFGAEFVSRWLRTKQQPQ